jgi:hypothetical protein
VTFVRLRAALLLALSLAPYSGSAQAAAPKTWNWSASGNVFAGYNYQRRKFRDFDAWESQNWFMAEGDRAAGRGRVHLRSMFSLEAVTLHDIGSPQVFQTGETFRGAPLIDYQHPHDLIMGLGGEYRRPAGAFTLLLGADLVGSPTLVPPPFMHRPSAEGNPGAALPSPHGFVPHHAGRDPWRARARRVAGRGILVPRART